MTEEILSETEIPNK